MSYRQKAIALCVAYLVASCGSDEALRELDEDANTGGTRHTDTQNVSGENLGIPVTGGASGTVGSGGAGGAGGTAGTGGIGGNGAEAGTGGSGGGDPTEGTSIACGDGIIDPTIEECDDGNSDPADMCSRDCQVRDVLVLPPVNPVTTITVLEAHFNSGQEGFTLVKNAFFNSTASTTYENGSYQAAQGFAGGGLRIDLGGINSSTIQDMSAGWRVNFSLAEPSHVGLFVRMKLDQLSGYENDEYSWAVVTLDGQARGLNGQNFIVQLIGDGNGPPDLTTGWLPVQLDFGYLAAGSHTLTLGGYNYKKNAIDEATSVWIDDLQVKRWQTNDPTEVVDRNLNGGRHPLSGNSQGMAAIFVEPAEPPAVLVRLFEADGVPLGSQIVSQDSVPALLASPVSAALPDGTFAAAYNELSGDGDKLGVALRKVVPGAAGPEPLDFANQTRVGSQANADMIWTTQGLVVAWEDSGTVGSGPDLKYRLFDTELAPISEELTLAAGAARESDVALAPFGGGFAAAWRASRDDGAESVLVAVGENRWTVGPHAPGAAEDTPALLQLDSTRLLVVFTVGTDPTTSGVNDVPRLQAAVIDINQSAVGTPSVIAPLHPNYSSDAKLSQTQPSATKVGSSLYVAWRSGARLSDTAGEELWLKELGWSGTALQLSQVERRLARWPVPNDGTTQTLLGEQSFPSLATSALPSGAQALFAGWVDYGRVMGVSEGTPDVVVDLQPVPTLRGVDPTKDCTWQEPCACGKGDCDNDTECTSSCICVHDKGDQFGVGVSNGVCMPAHCNNGAQDSGETGVDCGGSDCGVCIVCQPQSANGTEDFCTPACPCAEKNADCDFAADCAPGLQCVLNRGDQYGFASAVDVCVKAHCNNGVLDVASGELRVDCGGPDCGACRPQDFCSATTKCHVGEGDCDDNSQCDAGLVCAWNVGTDYAYASWVDVCVDPTCAARPDAPNSESYCSAQCPCNSGFGDCDSKNQCKGALVCVFDNGLNFNQAVGLDMCVPSYCTNGLQDTAQGEVVTDCGAACGTNCPSCARPTWLLSFEDTTRLWTNSSQSTNDITDGVRSLKISGNGSMTSISPAFNTRDLHQVGDQLLIDVMLPSASSPPAYWGDIKVVFDVPDAGIYASAGGGVLATINLTGLPRSPTWNTISFPVSPALKTALIQNHPGSSIRFVINWPSGSGTPLRFDNMRFTGNLVRQPNCYVPGSDSPVVVTPLPLLGFDDMTQWYSTDGLNIAAEGTLKTQGIGSLKVSGNNPTGDNLASLKVVTGSKFGSDQLTHVTNQFNFDVRPPSGPGGDIKVYTKCTSISEQLLGTIALSSLTRNAFNHVRFTLSTSVFNAYSSSGACEFRFKFNATGGASLPFYFDNMGFVQP